MSLSAIVQALAEAGATPAQLAAAVAAHEAAAGAKLEVKRAKDAARKREQREREAMEKAMRHAESRGQNVTPQDSADKVSPKEKSPTPPKEITPSPPSEPTVPSVVGAGAPKKSPTPKLTPRQILENVLTPEMADAVIDHRRRKRADLGVVAAEGLAKGFLATGDPERAARMMIERGWQGFKPEWFFRDADDGKQNHNQGRNGRQRGGIVDLAAGYLGVSPEWPDDRHGGGDDLRGSSADADAEDWPRSPTHAITGRA